MNNGRICRLLWRFSLSSRLLSSCSFCSFSRSDPSEVKERETRERRRHEEDLFDNNEKKERPSSPDTKTRRTASVRMPWSSEEKRRKEAREKKKERKKSSRSGKKRREKRLTKKLDDREGYYCHLCLCDFSLFFPFLSLLHRGERERKRLKDEMKEREGNNPSLSMQSPFLLFSVLFKRT